MIKWKGLGWFLEGVAGGSYIFGPILFQDIKVHFHL